MVDVIYCNNTNYPTYIYESEAFLIISPTKNVIYTTGGSDFYKVYKNTDLVFVLNTGLRGNIINKILYKVSIIYENYIKKYDKNKCNFEEYVNKFQENDDVYSTIVETTYYSKCDCIKLITITEYLNDIKKVTPSKMLKLVTDQNFTEGYFFEEYLYFDIEDIEDIVTNYYVDYVKSNGIDSLKYIFNIYQEYGEYDNYFDKFIPKLFDYGVTIDMENQIYYKNEMISL